MHLQRLLGFQGKNHAERRRKDYETSIFKNTRTERRCDHRHSLFAFQSTSEVNPSMAQTIGSGPDRSEAGLKSITPS